jgi:chemotaxis protein CheX
MEQAKIEEMVRAATQEVFQTMLAMEAEPLESLLEQGAAESFDGIVSLVGIAGAWTGTGSIYCGSELAMRVASTMFMTEETSVNQEVLDAMAELANMIVGNVKSMLETELGPLGLSIPTVIYGRNYRALSGGARERIVIPFHCVGHRFEVKICLVKQVASGVAGTRVAGALQTA